MSDYQYAFTLFVLSAPPPGGPRTVLTSEHYHLRRSGDPPLPPSQRIAAVRVTYIDAAGHMRLALVSYDATWF